MNKKLNLTLITMLTLICLISGGVFAAPQSSPNVSHTTGTLKDWTYSNPRTKKYIYDMRGSTGAMGNTGNLDVHLQRNTEYGAMLILGLSDYGKQASSVSYSSLFTESKNGLATTTGNLSGIYNIQSTTSSYGEHVAAGKADMKYGYYLWCISSQNRDEYTTSTNSSQKNGDAMNLFGGGTATTSDWLRSDDGDVYYGMKRTGFSYTIYQTYAYDKRNDSNYDYGNNRDSSGRATDNFYARAVVTQYN